MIIKREYVPFCVLQNTDKEAWEIFEKAFNESYHKDNREEIKEMLLPQCLYQRDIGWCFRKIRDVIEGFNKLDKNKPYDNGLSYKDVNETKIVSWGEDGLIIHLICKFDGIENIVKIVEYKD